MQCDFTLNPIISVLFLLSGGIVIHFRQGSDDYSVYVQYTFVTKYINEYRTFVNKCNNCKPNISFLSKYPPEQFEIKIADKCLIIEPKILIS